MNKTKILIVEDQGIIARDIESLLTDWGYEVVGSAASGEEALALFEAHAPDLALVDIQIHGNIDGIETVSQFNAIRPIPIVYLTAQADTETVNRAKASNPSAYLLKPFDERTLQISLDLAFDNFSKKGTPQYNAEEKAPNSASNVKLSADVILQNGNAIFIKQNYRFVKLRTEELVLIEADRNHSLIYTKQAKYIVRMPLVAVIERLQVEELIRVHRSFAVNIQYVEEFNDTEIVVNGKNIPFTSAYRDDFLRHFNVI